VLWVFTALAVVAAAGMLLFAADGADASTLVPMKPRDAAGGTLLLKSNANGETFAVLENEGPTRLTLITCYPFHALRAGGPLRYVVVARVLERG